MKKSLSLVLLKYLQVRLLWFQKRLNDIENNNFTKEKPFATISSKATIGAKLSNKILISVIFVGLMFSFKSPNTKGLYKVVTVGVFADLNCDGLTPAPIDDLATWAASTTSGNGMSFDLATPSDEFLGPLASSTIIGRTVADAICMITAEDN